VHDGDQIVIDVTNRRLEVEVSEEGMRQRMSGWKEPTPRYTRGVLAKYARLVFVSVSGCGDRVIWKSPGEPPPPRRRCPP